MRLSRLVCYPIKSCAGTPVEQWPLTDRGLRHDRTFMVVRAATGEFLTQREYPALALVRPTVVGDRLRVAVGTDEVDIPLVLPEQADSVAVSLWEHTGPALDAGQPVAELLSTHLGIAVRLVGLAPEHDRLADPDHAPAAAPVAFSDGYPLLLTSESSLADLNARLAQPLPMDRFRPNLVVADAEPYAEDGWRSIVVGDIEVDVVKPCARCTITTVDQATGLRSGAEPLRALGTYRRGERGVLFGQNAVHRRTGTLRVGDPVTPSPPATPGSPPHPAG